MTKVPIFKLNHLVVLAWMLAISPSVYGLSCYELKDQFFIQCEKGNCERSFRVREVRERGACKRRVKVEDVSYAMVQTINRELLKIGLMDTGGYVYHVTLIEGFYKNDAPKTADELLEHIHEKYPQYAKRFNTVDQMKKGTDIEKLKTEWRENEADELMKMQLKLFFDVAMLICGLALLFFTFIKLKKSAKDTFRSLQKRRIMFLLVCTQVGLLCIGLASLVFIWGFLYLMIPIIVLVLAYEIFLFKREHLGRPSGVA